MFFFGLFAFLLCGWFLPWWGLALAALVIGVTFYRQSMWSVAGAAAVSWAALAYIKDGQSHGLISQRMSGLFGLPSPFLMFVVMAVIGALTGMLFFGAGRSLRSRFT